MIKIHFLIKITINMTDVEVTKEDQSNGSNIRINGDMLL